MRNSALLLVSALAKVTPELILHATMPIFTFMGANVLRQDDEFSAHVVKQVSAFKYCLLDLELTGLQTMESVIPCLVQSLHKRKAGPLVGVSELLLSFAAAYEHIPSQRRLDLYVSLVNKVGPGEYLFALVTILLDKYPSDKSVVRFATDLSRRYSVKTRLTVKILKKLHVDSSNVLQTVKLFLDLILDARKPNPTFSKSLLQLDDVDRSISNLLPLAPAILDDAELISKASRRLRDDGEDAANIRALFANILEDTFILLEHYRGNKPCQWPT